jgi:hypothetical protein
MINSFINPLQKCEGFFYGKSEALHFIIMRRWNEKIFYSPTFISLITLITICYGCYQVISYLNDDWKIETSIRFVIASDESNPANNKFLDIKNYLKKYQHKKVLNFILKNDAEDDEKIDLLKFEIKRIKHICDTSTIIKVHLTDNTTYGEFVNLINIMKIEKHPRYTLWQDDFYIFPLYKDDCEYFP